MTKRIRVRGVERVVMGELTPTARARVTDRLFELWSEYFVYAGTNRDVFARSYCKDDTHIVMTFGPGGDLAGYGYINRLVVEVGGRRHLALGGGFFTRLEYSGTGTLTLALFQEVARIRLAYPTLPVAGISVASNPIIYDLFDRMFAIAGPRADSDPPPEALAVATAFARMRNLIIDPHDPWLIRDCLRSTQVERVLKSRAYAKRTPAMLAFERRVPDWTNGDALLVWAPLSASNIAQSMLRQAKHRRERG